MLNSWTTA